MFSGALEVAGDCKAGWHCKQRQECPAFQEEHSKLDALTTLSPGWLALVAKLKDLSCDGKENGVCCKYVEKKYCMSVKLS